MLTTLGESYWIKVPKLEDFLDYCRLALRVYSHLSYQPIFAEGGFTSESPAKIRATVSSITLPNFIHGMIREVCRPMWVGNDFVYIAYFPLDGKGSGPVPGLGWHAKHNVIASSMEMNFHKVDMERVEAENPERAPIFVASDKSYVYSNGCTPLPYILESINMLRHSRPNSTIYLGWRSKQTQEYASVPYEGTQATSIRFDTLVPPEVEEYSVTYEDTSNEVIYDAAGNEHLMKNFVRGHAMTMTLSSPSSTTRDQTTYPGVRPMASFVYGVFSPEDIHSFVYRRSVTEEELGNATRVRSKFNFGSSYRGDCLFVAPRFSRSFPSEANPSIANSGGRTQLSNVRKGRKRERAGGEKKIKVDQTRDFSSEGNGT